MKFVMSLTLTLAVAFTTVAFLPSAQAQNSGFVPTNTTRALRGNVNVDVDQAPLRLSRPARAVATPLVHGAALQAQTAKSDYSLFDASAFQSEPMVSKPFYGGAAAFAPMPFNAAVSAAPFQAPVVAPFQWDQRGAGGYTDATGTTKDVVWADKLYMYGGKFIDGTPVPKQPIRDFNAMGHAYRATKLSTTHFWTQNGR